MKGSVTFVKNETNRCWTYADVETIKLFPHGVMVIGTDAATGDRYSSVVRENEFSHFTYEKD